MFAVSRKSLRFFSPQQNKAAGGFKVILIPRWTFCTFPFFQWTTLIFSICRAVVAFSLVTDHDPSIKLNEICTALSITSPAWSGNLCQHHQHKKIICTWCLCLSLHTMHCFCIFHYYSCIIALTLGRALFQTLRVQNNETTWGTKELNVTQCAC